MATAMATITDTVMAMMTINNRIYTIISEVTTRRKTRLRSFYLIKRIMLMLLLPPIIGLPHAIYSAFKRSSWRSFTKVVAFMLCIAIYLAAINASKRPGGDQWQYYKAYTNVPDIGFIGSLIWIYGHDIHNGATHISGEFMNGVYNYLGYYITGGYYPLFVFLYTIVEYMLMYFGLYRFCQTFKKPRIPFLCGVLTLSFFYLFFQYTFQIQKQFFAQAIMMLVLGTYAATGKMTKGLWATSACAVFTHASTALFLPFLAYQPLYKKFDKTAIFLFFIAFTFSIFYGPTLASSVISDDADVTSYSLRRLANSTEIRAESGLVLSQVIVVAIPLALICFKKLWLDRKKALSSPHRFILIIVTLLLLTVAAMVNQFTAQYRYFMMLFAFMPYLYPMIFKKTRHRDKLLYAIATLMVIWFYIQFELIIWHYAEEWEIILKSPIFLLIQGWQMPT